jgi:hypothetical protein
MKMIAFWDIVPYSLIGIDRRFRVEAMNRPDDGGNTRL